MSQFSFENMVSEVTRLDGPLNRGPAMRWRRKGSSALEPGLSPRKSTSRTPRKSNLLEPGAGSKTPSSAKTPLSGKSPARTGLQQQRTRFKTPSKTPNKGSSIGQQDRFIPTRATTDMDIAAFAMAQQRDDADNVDDDGPGAGAGKDSEYRKQLAEAMNVPVDPKQSRILSFKSSKPKPVEGHMNMNKVIYSSKNSAANPIPTRFIAQVPDRILDAPELLDDYYLSLLDWSSNNHMAVGLGSATYIWDAGSGSIVQLMALEGAEQFVSCVSWIKEGNILAIGLSNGSIQLWDVGQPKLIRTMTGHAARVGSLSWNSHICTSGSRTGAIHHHDVRVADHQVAVLANHTQEVCGLSWSPDGRYLASGGNDNVLNVWNAGLGNDVAPLFTLTHHQAAVKALAWCPWQTNILASGGGTADRNIRLWNGHTGSALSCVDTQSQVSSILWSKEWKELISGHGFSRNQLTIWKYPDMNRVMDLTGHSARVLCLSMSPDGTRVASAAADETIRIWNCFSVNKKSIVTKPVKEKTGGLLKANLIR